MFLIYNRDNNRVVKFDSLDDIKNAVKTGIYGKFNYDNKIKMKLKNNFEDFKIIKKHKFPYTLCNDSSQIKNIIINVNDPQKTYYMLTENIYAASLSQWFTVDGTIYIYDNLEEIKQYCKTVLKTLPYMNGENDEEIINDINLIDEMINDSNFGKNKISIFDVRDKDYYENRIEFTIGNDLYADFTITKI